MINNEVIENIKKRRSIRSFSREQVSENELKTILEAGLNAPSGMNFQTWHFTAIQNSETLIILNDLIKKAFAKSDDPHLKERANNDAYCCYYHAPTLIVVSNEPKQWWASMDCACAIQNIFLAATSLNIGSCWINQLGTTCDDIDVRDFISSLGIPTNHQVFGCVALGYPDKDFIPKEKKIKDNLVTIIK